jgi:hypothetical protein
MPGLVPGIYVLRTCEVDGRVIEDVLALAKKQSIHPLCSDMDCFRLR